MANVGPDPWALFLEPSTAAILNACHEEEVRHADEV
jgi:hypothetical protein